jgi:hypothetical protein
MAEVALSCFVPFLLWWQDPLSPLGGTQVRTLLLEVGGHVYSPQQALLELLDDPSALLPFSTGAGQQGEAEEAAAGMHHDKWGTTVGEGWILNLEAEAWQDLDLLR